MMPFLRLLYQSESLITGTETDVKGQVALIVAAGQRRNERDGLTGALLFVDGLFIQALEGEVGKLEATFERICRDQRHRRVVLHEFSEASERVFAGWGMVEAPGTGNADGLFTSVIGDPPRVGRNTALARAALALMRDRLAGVGARGRKQRVATARGGFGGHAEAMDGAERIGAYHPFARGHSATTMSDPSTTQ